MVNAILRTYIPDDWSVITLGNYAQILEAAHQDLFKHF